MGYTTKFTGHIALSRALTIQEAKQLLEFNEDPDLIQDGVHPERSYLQWVPSESLDAIVWDQNEKFYDYEAWLYWLLEWLGTRGVNGSGKLNWRGECQDDIGRITVIDSIVSVEKGAKQTPSNHKPMTLDRLARMALDAATSS
jgi:hypothetical protein